MSRLTMWSLPFAFAALLAAYALPDSWVPVFAAVSAALLVAALFMSGEKRICSIVISSALIVGFMWSFAYGKITDSRKRPYEDTTQTVTFTSRDFGEITDYGGKAEVKLSGLKVTLYFFEEMPEIAPGDRITVSTEFVSPESLFDGAEEVFSSRGTELFGYAKGKCTVEPCESRLRYLPQYTVRKVRDTVSDIFEADVAGFMTALLTGNKTLLNKNEQLTAAMSKVGVSHIVAVSGMHVSFVVQFMCLLVTDRKKRALTGIPIVLFFMAMTGFTASVVRAGTIQILILLAALLRREADTMTSMSLALTILLALNPKCIMNVGLQLSFASTAGIIIVSGRLYEKLFKKFERSRPMQKHVWLRGIYSAVLAIICSDIGALVFTVPLSAIHFGSVSLASPIVNFLIIEAASLAFVLGYIAVLAWMIFAPFGAMLAGAVALLPKYIISVTELFARLSVSAVYTSNAFFLIWIVYVYVMAAAVIATKEGLRKMLLPSVLALGGLCFSFLLSHAGNTGGGMEVSVLNVGQGLCCVMQSDGCTAVIDCGSSSGEDAGRIASDYIFSTGELKIDLLVLTHYHDDHTNGVDELMTRLRVDTLAIPTPAEEDSDSFLHICDTADATGTEVMLITYEAGVSIGEAELRIYPPLGSGGENERGLTILCSCRNYDVLITGDADSDTEQRLIDEVYLPDIETLVVGHHGSKNSTSRELLAVTKPEQAIISVGDNSYGHPTAEALERLHRYDATVFRTDRDGTVTVTSE